MSLRGERSLPCYVDEHCDIGAYLSGRSDYPPVFTCEPVAQMINSNPNLNLSGECPFKDLAHAMIEGAKNA